LASLTEFHGYQGSPVVDKYLKGVPRKVIGRVFSYIGDVLPDCNWKEVDQDDETFSNTDFPLPTPPSPAKEGVASPPAAAEKSHRPVNTLSR
jgi:hypothetical protein